MPVYKQQNSKNWLIEFKIDGRRYRRSSGTNIKRKAERLEEKWRQEIYNGKHQFGSTKSLSIGNATDRYLKTVIQLKHCREKSKKDQAYTLNTIVKAFGAQTRLDAIQSSDIAKWRDEMLALGCAPATANKYLATLRAILNRAHLDWNAIKLVPRFQLLPLNNHRNRYISEDEEKTILEVCPPHLKNLVIFLVDTGARLSEALELTWADVDLSNQQRSSITLMKTKNGSPRRIPLTIRTKGLLIYLKNETSEPSQHVFLYRARGSQNSVPFKNPFGSWKTALRKSNIGESLRLHDLRHTFASRLVSNGVPIYDVSKLLGHKSITMTMRYAHLAPAAFETAIESLEKVAPYKKCDELDQVIDFKDEKEKRGRK